MLSADDTHSSEKKHEDRKRSYPRTTRDENNSDECPIAESERGIYATTELTVEYEDNEEAPRRISGDSTLREYLDV